MKSVYNPNLHNRRSIRLKGYDYASEGLYFITICCQNRACYFGTVKNGEMQMNDAGQMVDTQWAELKTRFPNIHLHEWVVMPNHFHGIIEIVRPVGAPLVGAHDTGANDGNDHAVENPGVGAPLVGAHDTGANDTGAHGDNHDTGRPQGHAPTGRPQGHAPTGHAPTKTIGDMMDAFKSITTVEYIRGVKNLGWPPFDGKLWQRNYYEHIIRDESSFNRISDYISNNPKLWHDDRFNDHKSE